MNEARSADPPPVIGPRARQAARLPAKGRKRHKLLVLIGAYHDTGVDPSVRMLAARTGLPRAAVIRLVDALERDGLLEVERRSAPQRYRYRLRAPWEERPT
jgi:DNA-binding MarR family transcriptional regulator